LSFYEQLNLSVMPTTTAPENDAASRWEYVSVTDYHVPAEPVTHTAQKGLSVFRHLFQRSKTDLESPLKTEDELRMLPPCLLERIAPAPDWNEAAAALAVMLDNWMNQKPPDPAVIILVGSPCGGHTDILKAWVERQDWRMLQPPSSEQILGRDNTWLSRQNPHEGGWVFPALEKAWLRHPAGLDLVRRFLDDAYAGHLGRGIIGCDSWAWAFLNHIRHVQPSIVLTQQAFDQTRLEEHFQKTADSMEKQQLVFRQSDNGHYVLPPPDAGDISGKKSNFLQLLAAYSRGNFGVAQAVWRAALQTDPDKLMAEKNEMKDEPTLSRTIWVTPWNQLKHPSPASDAGFDEAIVLHTLLLHGGLSPALLQQLVPFSSNRIMEIVFRLEASGVIARHGAIRRVLPRGYPAVRQLLHLNSCLLDQL
jgi:hypothetical protein